MAEKILVRPPRMVAPSSNDSPGNSLAKSLRLYGIDPNANLFKKIVKSKAVWNGYTHKVNADAFKFRYKGLDNSDELTSLFKEGYATGKNAWAPSEGSLPNDSIGSCQTQASQSPKNKTYVNLEVQGEEPNNVTKSNKMKMTLGMLHVHFEIK
ncbi:PIF-like protein [Striga asiatica]|uniref:PIF-like protein n=1 Tax=Striga asiatica TaxID=4170 RepID=A0A5A7P4D7_STRAF|nr:PIF-like protein [Striga asiatica]